MDCVFISIYLVYHMFASSVRHNDFWNSCSTAAIRARTLDLDHRGGVRTLKPQLKRETRCVILCSWLSLRACSMTAGFSTQAYLWMGIYDSQHAKQVKLEKELACTKQELKRTENERFDLQWTLHELSNGAAQAALSLFRAGQLQERISYETRDRIQGRLWRAEQDMNREHSSEMYRRT